MADGVMEQTSISTDYHGKMAKTLILFSFCVASSLAFAQDSYHASQPFKRRLPTVSENVLNAPRPRFRGWKHTPNAEKYFQRGCGAACLSGASSAVANDPHSSALISSSALSTFGFRSTLPTGSIPTAVATGDFNGDGHGDWVITNGGDNSIWVYLGKGDGTANLPTIIPLTGIAPTWVTAVSLRGNGILDLVVSEADSGTVGVLLGNGDGTFQAEVEYPVPAAPLFVLAADFNGDGKLDIAAGLAASSIAGPFAVLPGNGQGGLGAALFTAPQSPSNGQWLAAADLNGDGKIDLW